jgi:hypothetical protein
MPGVTAIITKTTKKQFSVAKLLYLDVYMESSLVIGACVKSLLSNARVRWSRDFNRLLWEPV